jgi:hypothetical protein|tara:strand:+ start:471 stop:677 length:207 start_codon:yes stop_codon:yes gene_type:complete
MFVSEMVVPFLYFISGTPRLIAACCNIALMGGIQLTGNFGFFNVLTAVLSITLLDLDASVSHILWRGG